MPGDGILLREYETGRELLSTLGGTRCSRRRADDVRRAASGGAGEGGDILFP